MRAHDAAMTRRRVLLRGGQLAICTCGVAQAIRVLAQIPHAPDPRWHEAAERMKRLALSWGDQPYGAVVVLDDTVVGEGPSRVVKHQDPGAHAEREAIRDAQRKLGRQRLDGSVLVSTSRPCASCEGVAADAHVARMFFGAPLSDAGSPRRQGPP